MDTILVNSDIYKLKPRLAKVATTQPKFVGWRRRGGGGQKVPLWVACFFFSSRGAAVPNKPYFTHRLE